MAVILQKETEALLHLMGEMSGEKPLRELLSQRKILLLPALPYPQIPQTILDNIGIIDVRTNEPGVVRFHDIIEVRSLILDNFSSEQHTAGLPADHSGTDHAVTDKEIIHGSEILTDHPPHLLVPRHHDPTHTRAGLCDVSSHLISLLVQIEKAVPKVCVLLIPRSLMTVHDLVKTACTDTVEERGHGAICTIIKMRQEHSVRIALPHLIRPDVDRVPVRIHIQKELRRIADLADCLQRMLPPNQREKRDRVQNKQKRTGHAEKIPHHKIGGPGCLKFREAVKHIERVPPFPLDQIVDLNCENFESVRELDLYRPDFRMSDNKGRVAGKAHINNISMILYRLFNIRIKEIVELFQIGDTPHHIVSHSDIVENLIHGRYPGFDTFKCSHHLPPFLFSQPGQISFVIPLNLPHMPAAIRT